MEGKTNYIRFRGRDNVAERYSVSQTYEIWLDPSPPEASIRSPSNNSVLAPDDLTITAIAYDNASGLDGVTAHLLDATEDSEVEFSEVRETMDDGGHRLTITWNASVYSYVFFLSYTDMVGNDNTSDRIEFTVNRPPSTVIESPEADSVFDIGDEIAFSAVIEDPDGDTLSITWLLDDSTVLSEEESFTTLTVPAGNHTITLVVVDSYYNVERLVNITVLDIDDSNGNGGGNDDWYWLMLMIGVVVTVALVGGYLWTRKRE